MPNFLKLIFRISAYFFSVLVKDESKVDFKKLVSDNWIEPPKRERKRK